MCCIRAYEYVVGEGKKTKIFAIYFQASGFQVSHRNMLSSAAINSLGDDMESPCRTPFLMLILLLSLCRWTVIELLLLISFSSSMYTSSIPCSLSEVSTA